MGPKYEQIVIKNCMLLQHAEEVPNQLRVQPVYQMGDALSWKYTVHTDAVPKPVLCTRQDNIRNIDEKVSSLQEIRSARQLLRVHGFCPPVLIKTSPKTLTVLKCFII